MTDDLGIAIATDGVGSKLVVAEQADRLETVGIDCVAMNVNDLICVGAEAAGCEIPGGELAVRPELIRGHPSPQGFDLCATAIGTVKIEDLILGDAIAPGDALIGVPSSGLHSNGYTLARRALQEQGGLSLDDRPEELGGASVADALLEPTVIYVRAVLELLRSDEVDVHGLSHITGGGLNNLLRIGSGYAIEDPLPVPAVFGLVQRLGAVTEAEMWEVFNMGCGLVAIVPEAQADAAAAILAAHHPGARRIGTATDTGTVTVPSLSLTFPLR